MKKIIFGALCALMFYGGHSQQPAMPDINKLKKMSPAELEAYKAKMTKQLSNQAVQMAAKNNLNINPLLLPDYEIKPPAKDIKRLSLIPSRPPTRTELVTQVQQSAEVIKKGIPAPKVAEVEKIVISKTVTEVHDAAVVSFYNNEPATALLMLMKSVSRSPDSLLMVNNLAAMLNLVGVEHKAIPLLQYCLQKIPNSSVVLNNLGQAFMGLGELAIAANYFNQCLTEDDENIEALHSMGMLQYYKKDFDRAMQYFEKEMNLAMRRSSLAMAAKMGKKFNLSALAKKRNAGRGAPNKNYFEEITLGKFELPAWPSSVEEAINRSGEIEAYAASVAAESLYWSTVASSITQGYNKTGKAVPGLYSGLVDVLLDASNEDYPPEWFHYFPEDIVPAVKSITDNIYHSYGEIKCPEPPVNSSIEVKKQFQIRCCRQMKKPLADQLISSLTAVYKPVFETGIPRYKSYINQLVAIFQLDPNPYNQSIVYNAVSGYFLYLHSAALVMHFSDAKGLVNECEFKTPLLDTDSLLQSDRQWRMNCPSFLNFEVDLGGASVKADCYSNKFAIEAGEGIMGGFEHDFNSGNSTLLLGPGAKFKFWGIGSFKVKSQLYVSFDKNKSFADFGIKNSAELAASAMPGITGKIKAGGKIISAEVSNTMSINSGYQEKLTTKGIINLFRD